MVLNSTGNKSRKIKINGYTINNVNEKIVDAILQADNVDKS